MTSTFYVVCNLTLYIPRYISTPNPQEPKFRVELLRSLTREESEPGKESNISRCPYDLMQASLQREQNEQKRELNKTKFITCVIFFLARDELRVFCC